MNLISNVYMTILMSFLFFFGFDALAHLTSAGHSTFYWAVAMTLSIVFGGLFTKYVYPILKK